MLRLKEIILVLLLLVLTACSQSEGPKADTEAKKENNETVKKEESKEVNNKDAKSLEQVAVDRHNEIRKEVFEGSEVKWSDEVAKTAQAYADEMAEKGEFEHDLSGKYDYGENIFAGSGAKDYLPAIEGWFEEKKYFDYASNSCKDGECGHYTQLIWKKSVEIGCGKAIYKKGAMKGDLFVVCRYSPRGNFNGEKPY